MAYVEAKHMYPDFGNPSGYMTLGSTYLIDATGEKVAFSGRVVYPDKSAATKDITRIQFRFGAVTKAGGSALTVSLQNPSTTVGPPIQPDGTQDQTVAIANADASFASNTWYRTGALSANRTVAHGELLSVVWEYDGSGRLGSDSVVISSAIMSGGIISELGAASALYTASWVAGSSRGIVLLEFSDGTFGTLEGMWPVLTGSSTTANTGSTPDEIALRFKVPYDCKIDALCCYILAASNAAFDLVLYSGTTALKTVSFDANQLNANATQQFCFGTLDAPYSLTKDTEYYVSVKPSTANNITFRYIDVSNNSHFAVHPGGIECYWASRTDDGAWSTTTTRRPAIGVRVSSVVDTGGGGGGGTRLIGGVA